MDARNPGGAGADERALDGALFLAEQLSRAMASRAMIDQAVGI
jgi:hypothetical protein